MAPRALVSITVANGNKVFINDIGIAKDLVSALVSHTAANVESENAEVIAPPVVSQTALKKVGDSLSESLCAFRSKFDNLVTLECLETRMAALTSDLVQVREIAHSVEQRLASTVVDLPLSGSGPPRAASVTVPRANTEATSISVDLADSYRNWDNFIDSDDEPLRKSARVGEEHNGFQEEGSIGDLSDRFVRQ